MSSTVNSQPLAVEYAGLMIGTDAYFPLATRTIRFAMDAGHRGLSHTMGRCRRMSHS